MRASGAAEFGSSAGDWLETENSVWRKSDIHSITRPRAPSLGTRAVMGRRTRAIPLVSAILLGLITTSLGFQEERLPGWQGEVARVGADGGSGSRLRGDRDPARDSGADTGGLPVLGSIHTDGSRIVKLSTQPRAYLYRGFLRQAECDYVQERAKPKLEKSTVVDNKTGQSVPSNIRTSDGMFFDRHEDEIIEDIERRIAEWTRIPWENGEGIQVLRYEIGQKYEPHLDAFSDKFNTEESRGGQRMATVLMYLSDVEEGGETVFPRSVDKPHKGDPNWSECAQRGVAVKARKGDALLFWSLDMDQKVDELSLHGGCPVIKGTKWSATKWMHLKSFDMGGAFRFPEGVCDDQNEQCEGWAGMGECDKNPKYMVGTAGRDDGNCMRACGECPPGSKRKEQVDMSKYLKDPEGIKKGVEVDIADIFSKTDVAADQGESARKTSPPAPSKLIGVDDSYADLARYLED